MNSFISSYLSRCGIFCAPLALLIALLFPEVSLTQEAPQSELRLGPGDAVRLFVYDGASATDKSKFISSFHDMEYIIDGMGDVQLSSLGKAHIAGLTAEEIASLLRDKFKLFAKEPYVVVIPLIRITLRGGFNQPGMYRFSLEKSFWDTLKEAGGLSGLSTIDDMYILRKDVIIYKDFSDALYKASSLAELGLESGDEIIAPRVNRITFDSIMRYFQFGMSILIFYLSFQNYNQKN